MTVYEAMTRVMKIMSKNVRTYSGPGVAIEWAFGGYGEVLVRLPCRQVTEPAVNAVWSNLRDYGCRLLRREIRNGIELRVYDMPAGLPFRLQMAVRGLDEVAVAGINPRDYPEFCDAYIEQAVWADTGEELTEEELDELNSDSEYVYGCIPDDVMAVDYDRWDD